ncbi:MAG: hypothetical protein V4722_27675, partial [Bacteroidota bacterium]
GRVEGIEKGIRRGIEKGIKQGIEKGIAQGIEKGIAQGEERKSVEFVKTLLRLNEFTIAKIASLTNVTEAFVLKVKQSL